MNTRLVGLAAFAALLAGYVAWQQFGPSEPGSGGDAPTPAAVAARSAAVKLNPLEGTDPAAYPAIVEKPLFNPSRQPRPDAPPPPPPPPEQPVVEEPPPPPAATGPGPQDYKLLGISSGPDGRIAAIRVMASGDVVYLRKGESIDNWTIVDVGDRNVAIGTAESPVSFGLFENVNEAPPAGAAGEPGMSGQQPMPLPLPMPQPQPQPGEPPLPEQHSLEGSGG